MHDFRESRTYVVHLQNAHKQIHQAVGEIERELDAVNSPTDQAQFCESLRRLRDTLAKHFKEEDEGGCMEEAASRMPRLSPDVAEIDKEHITILQLIDQLIERIGDVATNDFRESFQRFAKILHAHETAENRILYMAFGTGDFEGDSPPSVSGEE